MSEPTAPTVSEFYFDGEPHLAPQRVMADRCERLGISVEQMGVRPTVIATFFPQLTDYLAKKDEAERSEHWQGQDLFSSDSVSITTLPIGAPSAITTFEELVVCGMKAMFVVGAAGSLQPDLRYGSTVLPTRAIREEGTSHHYLPSDERAEPSPEGVEALEAAWRHPSELRHGLHWTTDAPYREHKERVELYREAGVLSVDMEVSALYAVAKHRDVLCAVILAISDELYEPWRIGFGTPEFTSALARCGLAAMEAAKGMAAR